MPRLLPDFYRKGGIFDPFPADQSRLRRGHAAQYFAVLRPLGVSLLRQDKSWRTGMKAKRLKAGWDNELEGDGFNGNVDVSRGPSVSFSSDALSLIGYALCVFASHREEFAIALVVAVLLAVGCWVAASNYSRLWNLRFQATRGHHLLYFIAAVCTLIFALLFASLKYTKEAAERSIDNWSTRLGKDEHWRETTHNAAYEEIKRLEREDPQRLKQLWEDKRTISIAHSESQKRNAEVWSNAAVARFQSDHPFLSQRVWAHADIPAKRITEAMSKHFQASNHTFLAGWSVDIAATEIKGDLQTQTDRIVPIARIIVVMLFILVQIIPFALIGYAAYQDLKVTT